jgi:hypothetical protein
MRKARRSRHRIQKAGERQMIVDFPSRKTPPLERPGSCVYTNHTRHCEARSTVAIRDQESKTTSKTSSLRGPQARGNPDGLSVCLAAPDDQTAAWIATSLRASQ